MRPKDAEWHDCMEPSFAANGTLVYMAPGSAPQVSGELQPAMQPLVGEHKDVRFARFVTAADTNPFSLLAQKEATSINIAGGFPVAHAPRDIVFGSLADHVESTGSAIEARERGIWQLCSIFFDPLGVACGKFMNGVPEDQVVQLEPRMRLNALRAFWTKLVAASVQNRSKHARTPEEKALLCLTQGDVVGACDVLVSAKDFKLATLVAQLPGTEQSRAMMKGQIQVWRKRSDWSEMSDSVRALYTVYAGETCVVEGNGGKMEDKVADFTISERFGLSWQQSFALRLHFGGYYNIADTIQAYVADLDTGTERIRPIALPSDGKETADTFMELLCLFAGQSDPARLFDPLAVSGNAFNSRLTWQLASLFKAKGHCDVPDDPLDRITYDFATELEAAGKFVSGAWILLHLTDDEARERAMIGLLERNGDCISTPGVDIVDDNEDDVRGSFEHLTEENHVPASLIWSAKAQYAKGGLQDPYLQSEWLLQAGNAKEAHDVLCTTLGPQAIIEQDYGRLSGILQNFAKFRVEGWEQGGQVYVDFVRLVRAQHGNTVSVQIQISAQRLQRGLAAMEDESGRKKTLEERVATLEMGRVLRKLMKEESIPEEDFEMGDGDAAPAGFYGMEMDMLSRFHQAVGQAV